MPTDEEMQAYLKIRREKDREYKRKQRDKTRKKKYGERTTRKNKE
jgi:hypothetical protein